MLQIYILFVSCMVMGAFSEKAILTLNNKVVGAIRLTEGANSKIKVTGDFSNLKDYSNSNANPLPIPFQQELTVHFYKNGDIIEDDCKQLKEPLTSEAGSAIVANVVVPQDNIVKIDKEIDGSLKKDIKNSIRKGSVSVSYNPQGGSGVRILTCGKIELLVNGSFRMSSFQSLFLYQMVAALILWNFNKSL